MTELDILRHTWLAWRARLSASRSDQRGITTLETVLWIAGLAVLAIGTLVVITAKVNDATANIPTGP